jgi:hypothetical protein
MAEDNILSDLFGESDSRKNVTIFLTFLVVIIIYHATVFWVVLQDEIRTKFDVDSFTIEFEETSLFSEESRIINNDETATIEFIAPNEMFDSHSGFGMLFVNVSYTETSGEVGDTCDTVSADLKPTGATADWSHGDNELSGMSSDCETISLMLYVFPGYDGNSVNVSGNNQQYWMDEWKDSTHGQGTFNLEIEVDVNGPATSFVPGVSDDNEEVTVTWEAVFFDTIVN